MNLSKDILKHLNIYLFIQILNHHYFSFYIYIKVLFIFWYFQFNYLTKYIFWTTYFSFNLKE